MQSRPRAGFGSDLDKYRRYSDRSALILLLTHQGLWALMAYRSGNAIYRSNLPRWFKSTLLSLFVIWQKTIEIVAGIALPYSATIGHSFYIGHFGNVIIHADAVIGDDCNISQGVTIGISGQGEHRGVPRIGNRVYLGPNATIAGDILVADDVAVAANTLVIRNVEPGVTVAGVPAEVVSRNGSVGYI